MTTAAGTAPPRLPDFPWDALVPYAATAARHPDGLVDLSVGTPVDPTPEIARRALVESADAPGYPQTAGTDRLRTAAAGWLRRTLGVEVGPDAVLPTVGSKELVAALPAQLGIGAGRIVAFPALAYPTYDVGARLAGALPRAVDDVTELDAGDVGLVWVNSPANPTGGVATVAELRRIVTWARSGPAPVVVASDECYTPFPWTDAVPVSVLHPSVCAGSHVGLLAVHSLSKRSNLAGYRAGFVAGDDRIVDALREVRRHAGLMVATPVQAAMVACLDDDAHVEQQRGRYRSRRSTLLAAFTAAGFAVERSEAGLYLWATRGEDCFRTVDWLAARGILVAPGSFYGPTGARHVRIALTATDERVQAAADRLRAG